MFEAMATVISTDNKVALKRVIVQLLNGTQMGNVALLQVGMK